MSNLNNLNGISLSSYSKTDWERLLSETAYRGLKINEISNRFQKGYECTFEKDHLINLISSTGKTTTVNMNKVLEKRGRWSLSRLFHNIRMLFPNSTYATKFNDRISKLAEALAMDARSKDFQNRCQANLGDFATLPTDIHDQIIDAMPTTTEDDRLKCIDLMKIFWKAPLGQETICGTIDVKKFAKWVDKKIYSGGIFDLGLEDDDLRVLFPYLKSLILEPEKFNFDSFDVIATCKTLTYLWINDSEDFKDDHFQHIAKLSKLSILNISRCPNISDEGLKLITGLNNLSVLFLSNYKITDEGLDHIGKLSNLTFLELDQYNVSDKNDLSHLASLKKLETLHLAKINLTTEGIAQLKTLSSLKHLKLVYNNFSDEVFESIGELKRLTDLVIYNNDITGDGLKYLAGLNDLQNLSLRRCTNITEENIQHVGQIKNLYFLDVFMCIKLTKKNLNKLPDSINWRAACDGRLHQCPRRIPYPNSAIYRNMPGDFYTGLKGYGRAKQLVFTHKFVENGAR